MPRWKSILTDIGITAEFSHVLLQKLFFQVGGDRVESTAIAMHGEPGSKCSEGFPPLSKRNYKLPGLPIKRPYPSEIFRWVGLIRRPYMDFVYIAFGLLFSIFGVLFAYGKILPYLKAWQNMSEGEKRAIRIEPLCRNIGMMIVLAGLIFFLRGMIPGFSQSLFIALIVAWLVASGFDCYWIEKSASYEITPEKKNTANSRIGSDRRKDL